MNGFHRFLINFASILYPCKYYGKENIPEGGAIIVCNHLSMIDCLAMAKLYNKDNISFLAKKEIFKPKFWGNLLKSFGAIPIDREKPNIKSLLSAIKVLKSGHKLLIFPEGTRNKTGTNKLQPLKSGSVILGAHGKYPIIPVMIDRKSRLFRKTHIIIGKPFELTEFYDQKLTEDKIKEMDDIVFNKMIDEQNKLFEILGSKRKSKKKK